ncbi:hypothetical protein CEB3_c37210 [Peptococcaceae bacterium CEB3]|nr:hypothetical protein CEB3_c37210 [Peptococcaceae bacterium CEB3]
MVVASLSQAVFLQALQLLFVLMAAPLIKGVLNRWKEFVQGKKGPSIFQIYRDLRKLRHKVRLIPEGTGRVRQNSSCGGFSPSPNGLTSSAGFWARPPVSPIASRPPEKWKRIGPLPLIWLAPSPVPPAYP